MRIENVILHLSTGLINNVTADVIIEGIKFEFFEFLESDMSICASSKCFTDKHAADYDEQWTNDIKYELGLIVDKMIMFEDDEHEKLFNVIYDPKKERMPETTDPFVVTILGKRYPGFQTEYTDSNGKKHYKTYAINKLGYDIYVPIP